jgi:hypothetical protein
MKMFFSSRTENHPRNVKEWCEKCVKSVQKVQEVRENSRYPYLARLSQTTIQHHALSFRAKQGAYHGIS